MPVHVDVLDDRSSSTASDRGFLTIQRLTLRVTFDDGTRSEPFAYDIVERRALDAVLMVLYAPRGGAPLDPWVCLRTALRPPVALRARRTIPVPIPDARADAVIWELPAGLIEVGDTGDVGIRATASRETAEETGYDVAPERFVPLGVPVYLSPGLIGEKVHVVCASVDRNARTEAHSHEVVEHASRVEWCTLSDALDRAERGVIEDCKTELALRRLQSWLRDHPSR